MGCPASETAPGLFWMFIAVPCVDTSFAAGDGGWIELKRERTVGR